MTPADRLAALLRPHLRTDGPFTLSSGDTTDWYLDARQATYDGAGAAVVGDAVLGVLAADAVAVGGMTMGADPVAVATAMRAAAAGRPLRAFSVRKQAKGHGVAGRLVGPIRAGDRAVVVEDTVTTGRSMLEAVEALAAAGVDVVQAVVLVDRSGGEAARRLGARRIPYVAILSPLDLGVGHTGKDDA